MVDWHDEEYNIWPTEINLLTADEKWLENDNMKKGKVHSNWFGSILHGIMKEKEREKLSIFL